MFQKLCRLPWHYLGMAAHILLWASGMCPTCLTSVRFPRADMLQASLFSAGSTDTKQFSIVCSLTAQSWNWVGKGTRHQAPWRELDPSHSRGGRREQTACRELFSDPLLWPTTPPPRAFISIKWILRLVILLQISGTRKTALYVPSKQYWCTGDLGLWRLPLMSLQESCPAFSAKLWWPNKVTRP